MKISCENCGQNYRIDEKKIPSGVSSLKCKKCGHTVSLKQPVPERKPASQPTSAQASEGILKIACPTCLRVYSIRKDKMPEGIPSITCRSCGGDIPVDVGDDYAGKLCGKCGYRRNKQDDALSSSDACPKCGLIYDKTKFYLIQKDAWQKEEAEKSGIRIHQDSVTQLRKPLFIGGAFIIAVALLFAGYGLVKTLMASFESDVDADFEMSAELASANRLPIFISSVHVAFIHEDGTVRTWGQNRFGQLGDGSVSHSPEPVTAFDLDNIVSLSGSSRSTLALRDDGTVWAWGFNVNGQLGDGSGKSRAEPVKVSEVSDIVAISGGDSHSMALGKNGRVWTWGRNSYGQLGYSGPDAFSPKMVPGIGSVIAVSAGSIHSVALRSDGSVWVWGSNDKGQLGLGAVSRKAVDPIRVPEFEDAAKIAASGYSTFAVKKDGTAWGWGSNLNGQLGDGTVADRRAPVQVADIKDIVLISPGESHVLALTKEGMVWAWGGNSASQLGNGRTKSQQTPVAIAEKIKATFVFAGHRTSMLISDDKTAWAWGDNEEGQIGDGTTRRRMFPAPTTYYEEIRVPVTAGLRLPGTE